MIEVEQSGHVVVLRMAHGKANTMDTALCVELTRQLQALEAAACRAVVLTGTGSSFSAGADLSQVLDGGSAYLDAFLPALSTALDTLFRFPKPIVAAVNGHAIAGGCVLVCACDRRLMAAGRARIGTPELLVGVPFPMAGLEIMRFATAGQGLADLLYTGATHDAVEAARRGLIDEVVPDQELPGRALEAAARLGDMPTEAFRLTKTLLRRPFFAALDAQRAAADIETANAWASAEVLTAMRRYADRTLGPRAAASAPAQ
ncbi:MAG TPA: enoyl-CoA hydratase/isomerase family protein [Sporichthyaceae bacterium]|nr:enoyl-CoA hydratase/isomerase family protein [Sporichthyaceae bacterium]